MAAFIKTPTIPVLALATSLLGCGDNIQPASGGGDGGSVDGGVLDGDGGNSSLDAAVPVDCPPVTGTFGGSYPEPVQALDLAAGCAGVFNPGHVNDLYFSMSECAWQAVQDDASNSVWYAASMSCEAGEPILVAIRRKRSGGTTKPGFKVDINREVSGQTYHGLKKLSMENGVGSGSTDNGSAGSLIREYLSWRLMMRSGAITGRASFVRVFMNEALVGTYVNVEQVDKRFLDDRLANDTGWLVKRSGSDGDGPKTNEGIDNPYEDDLCFLKKNGCSMPTDEWLASNLPALLDIDQLLTVGAVNALIANRDAPLVKDNNYLYYDWSGGGRLYFPWDLDTVMNNGFDVFTGTVGGGVDFYRDALYSNWEDDYDLTLSNLLAGPLSLSAIHGELDNVTTVAASAIDSDPHVSGAASAVASLKSWWSTQHAAVQSQVDAH